MSHSLSDAFTSFSSRFKFMPLPGFYLWFFHLWHKNILLCVVNNRERLEGFFSWSSIAFTGEQIHFSTQFSIFENFPPLNDNTCLEKQ